MNANHRKMRDMEEKELLEDELTILKEQLEKLKNKTDKDLAVYRDRSMLVLYVPIYIFMYL